MTLIRPMSILLIVVLGSTELRTMMIRLRWVVLCVVCYQPSVDSGARYTL